MQASLICLHSCLFLGLGFAQVRLRVFFNPNQFFRCRSATGVVINSQFSHSSARLARQLGVLLGIFFLSNFTSSSKVLDVRTGGVKVGAADGVLFGLVPAVGAEGFEFGVALAFYSFINWDFIQLDRPNRVVGNLGPSFSGDRFPFGERMINGNTPILYFP